VLVGVDDLFVAAGECEDFGGSTLLLISLTDLINNGVGDGAAVTDDDDDDVVVIETGGGGIDEARDG
jgi:hypothetical protein